MNLDKFTQAELHNALSTLFLGIQISFVNINEVLTKTDKFDAELSMRIVENLRSALEAANELLIDSYKRQGLTEEAIQERIDAIRKMYGFDS